MSLLDGRVKVVAFASTAKSAANCWNHKVRSSHIFSVTEMADAVKVEKNYPPITKSDRRVKIGGFLTNFTKFALDSAVDVSFKGFTGGKKVYKIVQEGLKYQPCTLLLDDKKKCGDNESSVEMQAKIEEMQEFMNNVKPQIKTSVKPAKLSMPHKKIPNEGIKESDLMKTNEKRIFIRSRL